MPKQTQNIFTEEEIAFNAFLDERDKMSNDFVRVMNKQTSRLNLIEGLAGGAIFGLIFGLLAGQTLGRVPARDEQGHVIEYKTNNNKALNIALKTIAATILIALGAVGIKTIEDKKRNQIWSDKLASDTLNKYFNSSLKNYQANNLKTSHSVRAAALIINNLPESELNRLRALALDGIDINEHGYYTVRDSSVKTAAAIISNFINYNPEIGYNVLRIMRGDDPTTYFLHNAQKTR